MRWRSAISATACLGAPPFIQPFPGSERALTLAEVQEMQTRLTEAGFDTGGTDGRVGNNTMKAVKDFQQRGGDRCPPMAMAG